MLRTVCLGCPLLFPLPARCLRSLFILSIAIQLFEFDTRFTTASIHLLISDGSVAHAPLMYSEEGGVGVLGKRHASHQITRCSPANHTAADVWTVSKGTLLHLADIMINQKGGFIANSKSNCRWLHGSSHSIKYSFTLSTCRPTASAFSLWGQGMEVRYL